MKILTFLGGLSFLLGFILLLPFMRRRAEERGLKHIYMMPLVHIIIGFVVFLAGIWFHANPP